MDVTRSRLVLALLCSAIAAPTFASSATYDVRYDSGAVLHVAAHLPAGDGRLLIAQGGGIDQLPDQWATFIRNLRVRSANGAVIEAESRGKEGWAIDSRDPVEVAYDVDLGYATGQWPAGNEQSGRLLPNALYTVTRPLFVTTTLLTDAVVRFHVPDGWSVATPWERIAADEFRTRTPRELQINSIVLGVFPSTRVRVGAFDTIVAVPGAADVPPLLTKALQQLGSTAAALFPRTPGGTYLMTFLHEESEDGESFANSAAVTSPDPFDAAGIIVTGNTLVHEILHHWFGGLLAPSEHDSMAWFTEGFTEYYANIATARSGAVPPDLLLRKLNNQVSGYLYFFESPLFNGVSVADAGKRKGAYRFGVYNAGWALALYLDVLLRSESGGRRSLDDAVRLLYDRNGIGRKPLTTDDVRAAVSEVAGRDLGPVFDKYVNNRNALPIEETLHRIAIEERGQPYAADIFLILEPAPRPEQLALRHAIFGF